MSRTCVVAPDSAPPRRSSTRCRLPSINALVDQIVDDPRNFGTPKLSPSMPGAGKPISDIAHAGETMQKIAQWYLQRMATASFIPPAGKAGKSSAGPLREKMVLFWHGLLVSSMEKPESASVHPAIAAQHTLFRRLALDDFQTLLTETSRDPAMLIYLDNWLSTADNPNENYARELQELFSLGVGNFNQTDVRAAALAGTGYSIASTSRSSTPASTTTAPRRSTASTPTGTCSTRPGTAAGMASCNTSARPGSPTSPGTWARSSGSSLRASRRVQRR